MEEKTLSDYTDLSAGIAGNEVQNSDVIHDAYEAHEMDEEFADEESMSDAVDDSKVEFERMDTDKTPSFTMSDREGTRENPVTDMNYQADMSENDSPVSVSSLCVTRGC